MKRLLTMATPPVNRTQSAWPRMYKAAIHVAPGIGLCGLVMVISVLLERLENGLLGRTWLEALVIAILAGTLTRIAWTPSPRLQGGISFSGKTPLEVAIVLLGASLNASAILAAGPSLLVGIVAVVVAAIGASYIMGRLLGLKHRMAVLVACGNSICGNSAIAAVALVIGADRQDVTASIAFTAVLGVLVVLGLPLLPAMLHLSGLQYGVLAGLTVYAVPQVLAATAPLGAVAVQIGTLVKLVRVLMLGPVVVMLTLLTRRLGNESSEKAPNWTAGSRPSTGKLALHKLVPWFILCFLAVTALRSAGLVPDAALAPSAAVAKWLIVLSMAALGLCTDLRSVAKAGLRVTAAVTLSLIVLGAISFGLIRMLGVA